MSSSDGLQGLYRTPFVWSGCPRKENREGKKGFRAILWSTVECETESYGFGYEKTRNSTTETAKIKRSKNRSKKPSMVHFVNKHFIIKINIWNIMMIWRYIPNLHQVLDLDSGSYLQLSSSPLLSSQTFSISTYVLSCSGHIFSIVTHRHVLGTYSIAIFP